MSTVTARLDDYCATAVALDQARRNAAKANPLFDHLQQLQKQLRIEPEGRLGIQALMAHPSVGVRLTAAAHSLQWSPDDASNVLEAIEAGPGLEAVSAKYTLKAYRNGTLDLDW